MPILDQFGKPFATHRGEMRMQAKFDAAQTVDSNEMHWSQADHLDPHAVASLAVRKNLRSRSRYECQENNPYLKGTLLTIANDFTGSGPKYRVTDKRLSKMARQLLGKKRRKWAERIGLRRKLWRMKMAKVVDGEVFLRSYANHKLGRRTGGLTLDFQVIETDRISSFSPTPRPNEVDGVRFDSHENATHYHLLNQHPGSQLSHARPLQGRWWPERWIIHWFRQDRGWLRGIPELTPSLPLCALLRRYTLAVVQHKEIAADFAAILETVGPANISGWAAEHADDLFTQFPIDRGMMTAMPKGYTMKQLNPVPDGVQFDQFTGSLLREITRPLLAPFNIVAGTSKDSNMASAVVDTHIYKGGIGAERLDCEESVLEPMGELYWHEAVRAKGYLADLPAADLAVIREEMLEEPPEHVHAWDKVGLDHTDPLKVAKAMEVAVKNGFVTHRTIQEEHYNNDIEQHRDELCEDKEFAVRCIQKFPELAGLPDDDSDQDAEESGEIPEESQ